MQDGLARIAKDEHVAFIDASDAFSGIQETTFTDFWHFSDFGHSRLRQILLLRLQKTLQKIKELKPR